MPEFAAEDWSLQAIVKESSGDFSKFVGVDHMDTFFDGSFHHQHFDCDLFSDFPEFFDMANGFGDELGQLYKPFYPEGGESRISNQDHHHVFDFQENQVDENNGVEDKEIHHLTEHKSPATDSAARINNPAYTPKYKKRKNQQKRVTIQVYADGLSSDLWAWRKYGQKPIKGSPYPRSYYRCSSSKGCLARKQVEQSCTDPRMFIITYTAEHSHSQPTRRNSLAGTVRQKFPSNKSSSVKQEKIIEETSSASGSPITPQQQEVDSAQARIKEEDKYHCDDINHFAMSSDFVFNDDFFSGLEDFVEFVSEPGKCHASEQKFSLRSCS